MTRAQIFGLLAIAAAAAIAVLAASCDGATGRTTAAPPTFLGSEKCATCHAERHRTWLTTSHAYALREATEQTVVGRFDGVTIEGAPGRPSGAGSAAPRRYRVTPFRRADGRYMMRMERDAAYRRAGEPATKEYEIVRAIGVSLNQGYLAMGDLGEWQLMPLAWSLSSKRWELTQHILTDISGDPGYYEDYHPQDHVFNLGCAQCHATNLDAGYDDATGRFSSTMLEGSVSCETCHGPGSAHAARHEAVARGAAPKSPTYVAPERLVDPAADLTAKEILGACGRCHYSHSWRYSIDADARVPWQDVAVPFNRDRTGFFADGRTSGLNYEGTVQVWSQCFLRGGMSCLSCHDMHSGFPFSMKWPDMDDDRQCTQCHAAIAKDPGAHSHHKAAKCVDCHMPKLITGQLARWRDHSVQSPDPVLTEKFGAASPNACNVCHADKSPAWAREHRERWWKPTSAQLVADVETVMRLRTDATSVATADLVATVADTRRRLFFRATALFALGNRAGSEAAPALRAALRDPALEMRAGALELLAGRPDPAAAAEILPLMEDRESRIVRIEAAFALIRTGWRAAAGRTTAGRGNAQPAAVLRSVYEEAKGMLKGRRVFHDAYERLAFIADALGEHADVATYLTRLDAIPQWDTTPWSDTALDLLQRRARHLMEAGDLDRASALFDRVATDHGTLPPLLLVADLGELGHRRGDPASAVRAFERLSAGGREGSIAAALGAAWVARLRGTSGGAASKALDAAVAAAQDDLTAGEWLRRAAAFKD